MNDPKVYEMLNGPPYPYKDEHAVWWIGTIKAKADEVLEELREVDSRDPEAPLRIVGHCPVRILREVKEDGSDEFLGDCALTRLRYPTILDSKERERLIKANEDRPVGDPEIIWDVGDYICASHQGKGIMSNAFATLMREWGIPRMGIRRMRVSAFIGNYGSIRVFEKNGFTFVEQVEDCIDLESIGREGKRGLYCLERTFSGAAGEI